MPDYEIRLFHADGTLALVHVSHHDSDDDAVAHAKGLKGDYSRVEVRRGGLPVNQRR
jgi:hypothetical protein